MITKRAIALLAFTLALLLGMGALADAAAPTAAPTLVPVTYPLTIQSAITLALEKAKAPLEEVKFVQLAYDRDDGRQEMEVTFLYKEQIYFYEFDPEDGNMLRETITDMAWGLESLWQGLLDGKYLTIEQAIEKALERAKLTAEEAELVSIELDMDDGRAEYDIELYDGNRTHTVELDAETGAVREYETERGWDD
jgi:uncharacterized membrane protein YkoI